MVSIAIGISLANTWIINYYVFEFHGTVVYTCSYLNSVHACKLKFDVKNCAGPPSAPDNVSFDIVGARTIVLSWPLSPAYLSETVTYKLHVLKDDQVIETIAVNDTVYEYSFKESDCVNYSFAVFSVNEAGTSANSANIFVARDSGEYTVKFLT